MSGAPLTRRTFTRAVLGSLGLTAVIPAAGFAAEPKADVAIAIRVSLSASASELHLVVNAKSKEKSAINLSLDQPRLLVLGPDGEPARPLAAVQRPVPEGRFDYSLITRDGSRPAFTKVEAGAQVTVGQWSYQWRDSVTREAIAPSRSYLAVDTHVRAQCGKRVETIHLDERVQPRWL